MNKSDYGFLLGEQPGQPPAPVNFSRKGGNTLAGALGLPYVSDEDQARQSWGNVNTDAIKQIYLQAFPPKPGEPIEPWDPVSAIPKLLAHYGILQPSTQPVPVTLGDMTQSMASGPMASRTQ